MTTDKPKLPAIIYACGCDFSDPRSGTMKRINIVGEYLAETYPDHPRYLLSPVPPLTPEQLKSTGWRWQPMTNTNAWPRQFIFLWRFVIVLIWRIFGKFSAEMLLFWGWSGARFGAKEKEFFSSHPDARVLVGRCDLAGLIRYRQPGQNWVIDTNDSIVALETVYRRCDKWRRMTAVGRESWLAKLRSAEGMWIGQYDRVISIAKSDQDYFERLAPGRTFLEDTAVLLPEHLPAFEPLFDVGFIGSTFPGSVSSAMNLIALAGRAELGGLNFAIAGGVCVKLETKSLPGNVRLLGKVEDSLAFLRQCRCVVMLAVLETGASIKFQEALAAGSTVLANGCAARFSLAKPGVTHLEINTISDAQRLLLSEDVQHAPGPGLTRHFTRTAFYARFTNALNWFTTN